MQDLARNLNYAFKHWLLECKGKTETALLFWIIYSYYNTRGEIFEVTQEELSNVFSVKRGTINGALNRLADRKIIKMLSAPGEISRFKLNVPEGKKKRRSMKRQINMG